MNSRGASSANARALPAFGDALPEGSNDSSSAFGHLRSKMLERVDQIRRVSIFVFACNPPAHKHNRMHAKAAILY
jgi:hypothetical protein